MTKLKARDGRNTLFHFRSFSDKISFKSSMWKYRSHYPERASTLDIKDAAAQKFAHSDVVFYLFIDTCFCAFNHPLTQPFKTFLTFYVSLDQNDLTSYKNATNSVYQAFLLLIERRHVLMFVTKMRQRKLHRYDRIVGGVFEVWSRCSLLLMTSDKSQ